MGASVDHSEPPVQRKRGRPATGEGIGNPIDLHVGRRIKVRRLLRGLTQEDLARLVGLSFQQVQKYERGANRVSAGRLFELSKALRVPIQFFFDEFQTEDDPTALVGELAEESIDFEGLDRIGDVELSELARAFMRLKNNHVRSCVMQLVQSLDNPDESASA